MLAIWVARRGAITPEIAADFQASREYGLARIGEIAEGAALKLELPPRELERYLTENIDFSLDEENLAGLRRYYEECARAGLIPRAREVGIRRRDKRRAVDVAPAFRRASCLVQACPPEGGRYNATSTQSRGKSIHGTDTTRSARPVSLR